MRPATRARSPARLLVWPVSSGRLPRGPLGTRCVHLCVDMQGIFAEETEWHTPWMARVLPQVEALVRAHPAETVFTRFMPLRRADEGEGLWRSYYERWSRMTLERLDPALLELVPSLRPYAPPATVVDKTVYSPWLTQDLARALGRRACDALVVSGGETDVCVLASVLGAVDRGYRVVMARNALCSSCDETHDALMSLYCGRFSQQVEVANTRDILENW